MEGLCQHATDQLDLSVKSDELDLKSKIYIPPWGLWVEFGKIHGSVLSIQIYLWGEKHKFSQLIVFRNQKNKNVFSIKILNKSEKPLFLLA